MGVITDDWASTIEYWLQGFLDHINWELDEEKTFHYLEQLKDKYSTSSYRKRAYQIKRFLQSLNVDWAEHIRPPAEPTKLPKRIIYDMITDTLNYFKGHQYEKQMRAIILLGSSSGMRPEEMYQLTQDDIDLDQRIVRINHDPDNCQTVKTKQSRITFFSTEAQQALTEYLQYFNNGCILSVLFGKTHVERAFTPSPIRVKDLRKFFSQQWDRQGGPTSIKKMLMGHSSDVDSLHYNVQNMDDLKQIYNKHFE